jgi:hypothetical protein
MKKLKYLFMVGVAAMLFTSCGTTTNTRSFSPQITQLIYSNDDLEFVGETEVSVTYSTWLGLFYQIHTVNGVEYDSSNKKITNLTNGINVPLLPKKLNKATYKVMEQFPEARYFQIVRQTSEKEKLFLGNEIKKTALIRAYKIRESHNHCLPCVVEKQVELQKQQVELQKKQLQK